MMIRKNIIKRIMSIVVLLIILEVFMCNGILTNNAYAADDGVGSIINGMSGTSDPTMTVGDKGLLGTINSVIGLIQVAGSGISILVITLLGIKYLLASPQDKAEVKKSAMPIVMGCILLFGAVNIVGIIENFSEVFKN